MTLLSGLIARHEARDGEGLKRDGQAEDGKGGEQSEAEDESWGTGVHKTPRPHASSGLADGVDCPLLFSATAADLRLSRERQPASANQPVPVRQPTAARSFFTATNPEPCGIPRSLSAQLRRRGGVAG